MLILSLLFEAYIFLSIKIVSQKFRKHKASIPQHIPVLPMCCPVVFWGAANARLKEFAKMALGLKANGLGNLSNGKRRVC